MLTMCRFLLACLSLVVHLLHVSWLSLGMNKCPNLSSHLWRGNEELYLVVHVIITPSLCPSKWPGFTRLRLQWLWRVKWQYMPLWRSQWRSRQPVNQWTFVNYSKIVHWLAEEKDVRHIYRAVLRRRSVRMLVLSLRHSFHFVHKSQKAATPHRDCTDNCN